MSRLLLRSVGRTDVPPLPISARLRSQLVYFGAPADAAGVPPLGEAEYFLRSDEVETWLDEGVLYLVSPLDTANMTEVELEEEQESFLNWAKKHRVGHIKVAEE